MTNDITALEPGHGEIVGEVTRADAAASAVAEHRPDVVVMDWSLPDHDGIWATRQIKVLFPHVDVVALTSATEAAVLDDFFAAGATAQSSTAGTVCAESSARPAGREPPKQAGPGSLCPWDPGSAG